MKVKTLLALVLLAFLPAFGALANALKNHPSPYLALHGDDPVQWRAWGAEAVEQARRENKLLFISSGYFACHWCHVMQRESYQNAGIAAVINAGFIPVKVDRGLQAALDAYLIDFVENTQGRAGWRLGQDNLIPYGPAEPLLADTSMPSPAAVLLRISFELAEREKDMKLYTRALKVLTEDHEALHNAPFFMQRISRCWSRSLAGSRRESLKPPLYYTLGAKFDRQT